MTLSPDWVVGFTDGEGCFHVSVVKNPTTATGYQVIPEFVIVQHERSIQVLYALKAFFGCGVVRLNREQRYAFRMRKLSCLIALCDFFTKHPLKTAKQRDFIAFRRVIVKMQEGRHLTREGLLEIIDVALRMSDNEQEGLLKVREELMRQINGPKASSRESPPPDRKAGER